MSSIAMNNTLGFPEAGQWVAPRNMQRNNSLLVILLIAICFLKPAQFIYQPNPFLSPVPRSGWFFQNGFVLVRMPFSK
jgi:hypothetical protein